MNDTGIWVVIPNWDGADFIIECLDSLARQTMAHTVVVVDNGSEDKSVDLIKKHHPDTIILQQDYNHGFAGGVNIGIEHARAQGAHYIALFNNDATAKPDWLENLHHTAEKHRGAGVVTGKLLRNDGSGVDSTGEGYSVWGFPYPRERGQSQSRHTVTEPVFAASGGASLYRVSMFDQIGLFDETFFAYYEDVDICFRMQLAGWKVYYEPTAIAYHRVSATSSRLGTFTRFHATKNLSLLYVKNMPWQFLVRYGALFILKSASLFASSILRGKPHVWVRGTWAAVRLLPAALRARKGIQKARTVPLKYIRDLMSANVR